MSSDLFVRELSANKQLQQYLSSLPKLHNFFTRRPDNLAGIIKSFLDALSNLDANREDCWLTSSMLSRNLTPQDLGYVISILSDAMPSIKFEIVSSPDVMKKAVDLPDLTPVHRIETVCALNGLKDSRLMVAISSTDSIIRMLPREAAYCYSRNAIAGIVNSKLGQHSNLAKATTPIEAASPQDSCYLFISSSRDALHACAAADEKGQAGTHYRVPSCCQNFFTNNWNEAAANYQGDLFSILMLQEIAAKGPISQGRWQTNRTNLHSLVGSYCLYFPCSTRCEATVTLIDQFDALLSQLAPEFAAKVRTEHQKPILWIKGSGIGRFDDRNLEDADFSRMTWTCPTDLPAQLGQSLGKPVALKNSDNFTQAQALIGAPWALVLWE